MKNLFTEFQERLDAAKKMMETRSADSFKKLEELGSQFTKEINRRLTEFDKRRNLIAEAFKRKIELRKNRIGVLKQLFTTNIRFLISIPFIYILIIPAIILHVFMEVYHRVCFPLYGIRPLKTKKYFVFDRHHLSYLNWFEKLNCVYCSYFNCLVAYTREIAAITELYWCPIKHARRVLGTHDNYPHFVDYLDGEKYREKINGLQHIAKHGPRKEDREE